MPRISRDPGYPLNEKPLEHSDVGFTFTCDRCDLTKPINVTAIDPEWTKDPLRVAKAAASFAGWHACAIWDQLNGFAGYEGLTFEFDTEKGTYDDDKESD